MKKLHYVRPNDLSKLHDELLAAIPALRPVPMAAHPDHKEAVMTVQGRGDDIWLTVPDDTDETAITTVVAFHDPLAARPATPAEARAQRIGELLAIPRSDWTVAQQRELLQLVAQNLPPYEGRRP